jgi:thymidine kinase
MFSGKSEELIKRIKRLGHANVVTLVIKPSIDDR